MGLCKCPKRKTTSHFCFHHCVNVCEHCIVNNHTTCVVKSYTTWLKEASGSVSSSSTSTSALCAVCQKQFVLTPKEMENLNDSKTPIRLLCYHIIHARCLSTYVKKQLKEGNVLICPSCSRPLWLQQEQSQDSNNVLGVDSNELSPVALQLYKHLSDNCNWWGQALITNINVEEIEKHLLEDEELQKSEDESALEVESQITPGSDITPLTLGQTVQSPNINSSCYDYNNATINQTSPDVTTINYRSNTHQTYQPIHHRHFNNNYGIDSMVLPQLQQQQCLSINMTTVAQGSDLSNRHTVTSSTLSLLNDNNLSNDEQLDPSGKYRPKKFNNQSWSLSYQRLLQHFCGTNKRSEENNTTKNVIILFLCMLIIVILLLAITSYTRSNNEPYDSNSIDYGGDGEKSVDKLI